MFGLLNLLLYSVLITSWSWSTNGPGLENLEKVDTPFWMDSTYETELIAAVTLEENSLYKAETYSLLYTA